MEREPLTHFIYTNLSASDRRLLEKMAEERGATLSGVVRRLIREAANQRQQKGAPTEGATCGYQG